jgi:hypothetical protein
VTSSRWALALLACAAFVLAACSSSNAPNSTTTSTTRQHQRTTTSAPSGNTSVPSTTSTTGAAAAAGCNHISATSGQGQGAAGTITGTVTVTNTGSTPCTVNGYPNLALFSGSGAPLTVTVVNGLTVSISPPADGAPAAVTLAPAGTAQFAYQFSDVPVGSETSCPTSEAASVTMPGATTGSANFALAIDPCNNGTVHVSPVYSGS